jgi:hypothetical protein
MAEIRMPCYTLYSMYMNLQKGMQARIRVLAVYNFNSGTATEERKYVCTLLREDK